MKMETVGKLKERIAQLQDELVKLRRDFHAHPELGFREFMTAGKVEAYLQALGLATERVSGTGVVALLQGEADGTADSPVLMLRADMDALPIDEETGLEFASKEAGVMHACGHDAHMAMLLVTARLLSELRGSFAGTVKFVFQPDEEVAGAVKMVSDGVLENPRPDAAMGIHIWSPLPSGVIGVRPGAVTSSMDVFTVTIYGKGGHTGYPESAVDPVLAAAAVIQGVQQVQTRLVSAMKPTVIMFGRIAGGTKSNIIPGEVVLEGTIRYQYSAPADDPEHPLQLFRSKVEQLCTAYGCSCTITAVHENDAVVNDPQMTRLARETAVEMVGQEHVVEYATMACEDFSSFADRVPAVFAFIGTANEQACSNYPHHNSRFTIDEATLPAGVEFLVVNALRYFGGGRY